MTTSELFEQINNWEMDAGESFTDYFMHDNVTDSSWAFWLLGKGHISHANDIILEILAGNKCIDQELLYEVYPEYVGEEAMEWSEANHYNNVMLWAEFLVSTPYYLTKVQTFFKER